MKFSDNQIRAIKHIKQITDKFGEDRWFTQSEVIGAGYKTLTALVNKGVLRTQYVTSLGLDYYQIIMKSEEHGSDTENI